MAFLNHLASLVVNVIINTRGAQQQLQGVKGGLHGVIRGAAQFYLIRAGILTFAQSLTTIISKTAELEQGFITLERTAGEFAGQEGRLRLIGVAVEMVGVHIKELQEAIAIAGQLGIRGKQNILDFSKTIVQLSTVTGASPEYLASNIARLMEVLDIAPDKLSNLSSAVLQLADQFNAVPADILEVTARIAATGKTANLSTQEILALATAMKEVEKSKEISGTSLNRFLAAIGGPESQRLLKGLKGIGVSNESADRMFTKMRQFPFEAIKDLFALLKILPQATLGGFLKDMGFAGARNQQAILKLIQNSELLDKTLESGTTGWDQNIRLSQQFTAQSQSLNAAIKDLKESWDLAITSFGNIAPIQAAFDIITNGLNAVASLMNEPWDQRFPRKDVLDLRDPESIKKRISQIQFELAQNKSNRVVGAFNRWDLLGPLPRLLEWLIPGTREKRDEMFGGEGKLRKERESLYGILEKIIKGEEKAKEEKEKVARESKEKTAVELAAARERLKKSQKSTEHFKGFMNLEDAWKNKLLDTQKDFQNQRELKALEDAAKHLAQIEEIDRQMLNAFLTRSFPAVVV